MARPQFQSPSKIDSSRTSSVADNRFQQPTQRQTAAWISIATLAGMLVASASGCQLAATGQNAQGARLYEQGQYTAALQQFQKVILTDPDNADGYYNLAATNHRIANQRGDLELIKQAEALYNQCLDHEPNHIECHRGLAVLLIDSQRADRAFALMKNWASENPKEAAPRVELARLYEEINEPQTALKYLEDAVQLDATNARAWLALGRLRERSGDLVQALQNYQQSLAINPSERMATDRISALSRQLNATRSAQVPIRAGIDSGMVRY